MLRNPLPLSIGGFAMKRSLLTAAALTTTALLSGTANAATLFSFSTTTGSGYDPDRISTTVAPNVIAPTNGDELDNGVVNTSVFDNSDNTTGWDAFRFGAINPPASTFDSATEYNNAAYFEVTISAQAGFKLNLSSLSFNSAVGGPSATRGFEIYTAVDGGTFAFGDTPILDVTQETGTRSAPRAVSVDLTAATYQNIDSITFRYYVMTTVNNQTIEFEGWTLDGSVVPEPGSLALLGLGGLLIGTRRRRD